MPTPTAVGGLHYSYLEINKAVLILRKRVSWEIATDILEQNKRGSVTDFEYMFSILIVPACNLLAHPSHWGALI